MKVQPSRLPYPKRRKLGIGKAKILVVDDEIDTLNLVKMILETESYKVQIAQDGQEAFSRISQEKPDLILLDIKMPGMNGYEICRKLKRSPETATVPIIMFSASDSNTKTRVREAGADGFMLKPFTIEQLLDVVKKHLNQPENVTEN